MAISRGRTFLGISSIALLVLNSFLLFQIAFNVSAKPQFYYSPYLSLLAFFNAVILLGWVALREFGGIPITTVVVIFTLWLSLRTGYYGTGLFILTFLFTAFAGYLYLTARNKVDQLYALRSEKLSEEINVLSSDMNRDIAYVESLEDKLARYSSVKEVAEALSADLVLENINKLIIDRTMQVIGKPGRVLLFLVDVKKQELMLSASDGVSKILTKKGDVFDHWVLRQRKSLVIDDLAKDFRFAADDTEDAKESFRSIIETPLVSENKVIGILRYDSLKESAFSHDDLRLLDFIADLGAVAIENATLFSTTQELAIKDSLTGLAVRRYFMERFEEEIRRSALRKGQMSLLMIDIDHFKKYNDQFGHTAGDLVLRHMARSISSMVREGDMVARYGGEEMAVLFIGLDKEKAAIEAEAIRKRIEEEPLMLRKHKARVTVSIGVSSYPQDAMLEEELIKIADERLYKAKAAGRNRVCAS
jgi:diguanylate cyclase (GGDEF)-like protein